jgi:ABC-type sugar transport system permease subunit
VIFADVWKNYGADRINPDGRASGPSRDLLCIAMIDGANVFQRFASRSILGLILVC